MSLTRRAMTLALMLGMAMQGHVCAQAASPIEAPMDVIIDTDFGLPPIDDAFAVGLLLNSPEVRVRAITTVAGNQPLDTENVELEVFMERMGRADIPLYAGADHPMSNTARRLTGPYVNNLKAGLVAPRAKPSAGTHLQVEPAADLIARSVLAAPHEVTILAIGPLTNIATAIQREPRVASLVKRIVIMGGYFPSDSGVVLHTAPALNAEFNFWVDPEAARIVIESGADIELSPIDVSATVPFTSEMREKLAQGRGSFAAMVREFMPRTDKDRADIAGYTYFYDPLAAAGIVAPAIAVKSKFYVDIDINAGIDAGAAVRRSMALGRFPYGEKAGLIDVETKIDVPAFYRLIEDRLAR